MVALHAFRKLVVILAIALGCCAAAGSLPDDPYQRWQLLDGTIHANASWIYERSVFDPTPIDVVFLGPSRTLAGVNAPQLGQSLKTLGLPSNVVNFSLPETGRNTNYAVAKMLLSHKRPRLMVLGVIEKPSRFGHPAFKYLADRASVTEPGYVWNIDYLADLSYLPFRQMRLFVADILPGGLGLKKTFDPAKFRGESIDTNASMVLDDGTTKVDAAASIGELKRGVRKLESGMHPPFLPSRLADVEFGDERYYIDQIAKLAAEKGTKIAFLFIPYYNGPDEIQELQFYDRFGPTLNASFVGPHAEWYGDYGHLDHQGARVLTDWLVEPVAALLRGAVDASEGKKTGS